MSDLGMSFQRKLGMVLSIQEKAGHINVSFLPDDSAKDMLSFMWQDDLVHVAHFIRLSLGRVYTDLDTVNI